MPYDAPFITYVSPDGEAWVEDDPDRQRLAWRVLAVLIEDAAMTRELAHLKRRRSDVWTVDGFALPGDDDPDDGAPAFPVPPAPQPQPEPVAAGRG